MLRHPQRPTSPTNAARLNAATPRSQASTLPPPINNVIKRRRRLTASEQRALQSVYDACPKPTAAVRDRLADRLGMDKRGVQIWFQNRRAKGRRDAQEAKQPALLFKATAGSGGGGEGGPQMPGLMDEERLEELLSSCSDYSLFDDAFSLGSAGPSSSVLSPLSMQSTEGSPLLVREAVLSDALSWQSEVSWFSEDGGGLNGLGVSAAGVFAKSVDPFLGRAEPALLGFNLGDPMQLQLDFDSFLSAL